MRIIDYKNQIASMGRIEVLINDKWYSICKESDAKVPKFVCNSLGYKYGFKILDENILSLYNNQFRNEASRKNLMCEKNAENLDGCFIYNGVTKCNGNNKDLIVRCSDYEPYASINDKTNVLGDDENGNTIIEPIAVYRETNDSIVKEYDYN